ncbi:MAG: DUF4239 domain-containing protein [Planctomycetes bacterium]|nr:DUF4239 domain-containing protein [Planctomycetota bacterium]
MHDYLYDLRSGWIASALLAISALCVSLGHRLGRRAGASAGEAQRAQVNALQTSMLGLLALVLGFTFSLALGRYDDRSTTLAGEANALGTTLLRSSLLPRPFDAQARILLAQYVELRIEESSIGLDDFESRAELHARTKAVGKELWGTAKRAVELDDSPVRTGLFVQSLNDMLDAFDLREAVLNRHVPEFVMLLLFVILALAAFAMGYASGFGGHRPPALTHVLLLLLVLVMFLIIDLDRPRRGWIRIDRTPLLELGSGLSGEVNSGPGGR